MERRGVAGISAVLRDARQARHPLVAQPRPDASPAAAARNLHAARVLCHAAHHYSADRPAAAAAEPRQIQRTGGAVDHRRRSPIRVRAALRLVLGRSGGHERATGGRRRCRRYGRLPLGRRRSESGRLPAALLHGGDGERHDSCGALQQLRAAQHRSLAVAGRQRRAALRGARQQPHRDDQPSATAVFCVYGIVKLR